MAMSAKVAAAATVLLIGAAGPSAAMPIATSRALGIENVDTSLVQQARVVCGTRGCIRVGPRWVGPRRVWMGPRRSFAFAPGRFHRDWRWHRRFGWR
jgi:hypothetical protein